MMLRGLRVLLAICVALSLWFVAPGAFAQPAVAQKLMVEGDRAGQAGQWEAALAAYQKAHAASPSGATQLRVANALYKLGRVVEAHDAYDKLVQDKTAVLLAGDKKLAQERLIELKGKTGTIALKVNEAGATVTVDGAAAGTTPLANPVRVAAGTRKVTVAKAGFVTVEKSIDVAGRGDATLDVKLEVEVKGGKLTVTVKGAEGFTVLVDGLEVGPAPWTGTVTPGAHKVSAKSGALSAADVSVDVKEGDTQSVELVPAAGPGSLEVRVETPKAEIFVDGAKVGDETYKGELAAGEHDLKVTAEGFAPFEKKVTIVSGEIVAETVALRKAAAGAIVEKIESPWTFDGLYGGFQIIGMFEPTGSGSSLDDSCDSTGATSCETSMPMGGALAGYIGWAFAPIGLELFLAGAADVSQPKAIFDGSTGSEVNPLVAQPPREESFTIGRFGGGGAFRLRVLYPIDIVRITGAIGAGLAYRHMLLGRETVTDSGATSDAGNQDGTGYFTGLMSLELGVQILMAGTTSFTIGANLWLEHAGDDVSTPARNDVFLTQEGEIPIPQATPSYDMASGTQFFVGPFIGIHAGP